MAETQQAPGGALSLLSAPPQENAFASLLAPIILGGRQLPDAAVDPAGRAAGMNAAQQGIWAAASSLLHAGEPSLAPRNWASPITALVDAIGAGQGAAQAQTMRDVQLQELQQRMQYGQLANAELARAAAGTAPMAGAAPGGAPGGSGDYADRVLGAEGTGKNPLSTAAGHGGFIEETWLDMMRKYRPDLIAGKSNAEILAMRGDRTLGREMVNRYRGENAQVLAANGLPDTDANAYAMHFFGPGHGPKVLRADPSTPLAQIFPAPASGPEGSKPHPVIASNPFLANWTAGDAAKWAGLKMGAGPAATGTTAGQMTAPAQAGIADLSPYQRANYWRLMADGKVQEGAKYLADQTQELNAKRQVPGTPGGFVNPQSGAPMADPALTTTTEVVPAGQVGSHPDFGPQYAGTGMSWQREIKKDSQGRVVSIGAYQPMTLPRGAPGQPGGPEMPGGATVTPAMQEQEANLRAALLKHPEYEPLARASPFFNRMIAASAANTKGAPDDRALVDNFVKIFNPGVMTNEDVVAQLRRTGGLPEQILAKIAAGATGQLFTQAQRDELMATAAREMAGMQASAHPIVERYRAHASTNNLRPDQVHEAMQLSPMAAQILEQRQKLLSGNTLAQPAGQQPPAGHQQTPQPGPAQAPPGGSGAGGAVQPPAGAQAAPAAPTAPAITQDAFGRLSRVEREALGRIYDATPDSLHPTTRSTVEAWRKAQQGQK